jgi:hypothetical protein
MYVVFRAKLELAKFAVRRRVCATTCYRNGTQCHRSQKSLLIEKAEFGAAQISA